MSQSLPMILSAGLFDSNVKFPGGSRTQLRLVTAYEAEIFCTSGGSAFINGIEYPITAGKLLLAKPGDIRCSQLPFACKYVHFAIEDPAVCQVLDHYCGFHSVADPQEVEEAFLEISELYYSTNPLERLNASGRLVTLLHKLTAASAADKQLAAQARAYIAQHFNEDLSVPGIAEACGISASYLHRLFRNRLHTTPGEFILSCRISSACLLLVNTSMTLGEVAAECGFHSQSYFSDCFKRKLGISPILFRKNATYPL